jgi:hypothetical protein
MPPLNPRERVRKIVESGGGAGAVFWRGQLQSLVEVWKYEGQIILTWEEAPDGAQYDESRYTRDERHVFPTIEEALAFLDLHSVALEQFTGTIKRKRKNA